MKLAELLENEGGGKSSTPSNLSVVGLIEKANPALAVVYSTFRAIKILVMRDSRLSIVTTPMALTVRAAGVERCWLSNDQNEYKVAMIAAVT